MATEITSPTRLEPRPEFAAILRTTKTYSTGAADAPGDRVNGTFDRLMLQSGISVTPPVMLLLCLLTAIAFGGAAFVVQEHLLSASAATLIGAMLPIGMVIIQRNRRQSEMLRQMPGMVSELARAARTGRSLEHFFATVAADTAFPLGHELQLCSRRMEMGLSLADALRDIPERTGLTSMHVLVTALSVHQETGGDLVKVLDRLSHTIRDRLTFMGRLRAATTASRATAVLMLILPPLVVAFFVFRDPEYITNLLDAQWGRRTFFTAIALQIVGSVLILRILKNSQRT